MKINRFELIFGALIICLIISNGCASKSGYKQADKSFTKMDALKSELLQGKDQIDKMISSLNQVVNTADSDPRPAYEQFKKEYSGTQKQADRVRKTAEQMRKEGQAYFASWEAEFEKVANEDMKRRFENRKTELSSQYDKIAEYAQEVRGDFDQFKQNINDISVILNMDLTPAGINSISGDVRKVTEEAATVKGHIDSYVEIIDKVAEVFRAGQAPQD